MQDHLIIPTTPEIIGEPISEQPIVSTPFVDKLGVRKKEEDLLIQFNDQLTRDLFPPVVSAHFETTKEEVIVVNAFVLIPYRDMDAINFVVGQQFAYSDSGNNQLNLYISYDEAEVITNKYIPLLVSFKTNPIVKGPNEEPIITIQTFLVNEDPVTSRGTITTVKKPMGLE